MHNAQTTTSSPGRLPAKYMTQLRGGAWRPTPDAVWDLWERGRIRIVGTPDDPLWDYPRKDFQPQAYYPNQVREGEHVSATLVNLPEGEVTFWPKHPRDLVRHQALCRAGEMLTYRPGHRRPLIELLPPCPGSRFFRLRAQMAVAILEGEADLMDIHRLLSKHDPAAQARRALLESRRGA